MTPDGDTAAHLRKQVGGLFFESFARSRSDWALRPFWPEHPESTGLRQCSV